MDLPRHWRLKDQRYRLEGVMCDECGAKLFPPRQVCPHCRSRHLSPYRFRGEGEVYSYSTVYQAPEGFEEYVPYTVALVRLDEGPLVTAQLTDVDPDEAHIGMRVRMVTRKIREYGEDGLIVYGYKFRPTLRSE
ncbi:MAG: Zn-ribbon domain-containing OB-fold protein [Anaerolineae bacterium]